MRHNPMYMADYAEHLDKDLKTAGEKCCRKTGRLVMYRQLKM